MLTDLMGAAHPNLFFPQNCLALKKCAWLLVTETWPDECVHYQRQALEVKMSNVKVTRINAIITLQLGRAAYSFDHRDRTSCTKLSGVLTELLSSVYKRPSSFIATVYICVATPWKRRPTSGRETRPSVKPCTYRSSATFPPPCLNSTHCRVSSMASCRYIPSPGIKGGACSA